MVFTRQRRVTQRSYDEKLARRADARRARVKRELFALAAAAATAVADRARDAPRAFWGALVAGFALV